MKLQIITLLALAAPLAGQTTSVFPPAFANIEGVASTAIPFGLGGPVRIQLIYHVRPPSGMRKLTGITFRADGAKSNGWPIKRWLQIFVTIGFTSRPFDALSPEFDENVGKHITAAVRDGRLELPAQPPHNGNGPRPFDVKIPFDKGAVYPFHDPDDGWLLIDMLIGNQPSGQYPVDTPFVCDSQARDFGRRDSRCKTGKGDFLVLDVSRTIKVGGSFSWTLSNVQPLSPCLFIAGLPVTPVDLTPAFAPGCYKNISWLWLNAQIADRNGRAGWIWNIPQSPRLRGLWLYMQGATLDLAANRMGVVWSLGRQARICGPVECGRVFATDTKAKRGIVQVAAAPVIKLTWTP